MLSKSIFTLVLILATACQSAPIQKKNNSPNWIENSENEFPAAFYLTSVGQSDSREKAEKSALQKIANVFQVRIQSNQSFEKIVKETSGTGESGIQKTANIINQVTLSNDLELINTKFEKYYFDKKQWRCKVLQ